MDPSYHPTIDPADITAEITNPYRPSQPSTTYAYEGVRDGQPRFRMTGNGRNDPAGPANQLARPPTREESAATERKECHE